MSEDSPHHEREPRGHTVRLFAGLKEAIGAGTVVIRCSADATAGDLKRAVVLAHPALAALVPACRVAADERFLEDGDALAPASRFALIPPVSGGSSREPEPEHDAPLTEPLRCGRAVLSPLPLDAASVQREVEHRDAGGVTSFVGNVRERSRGLVVTHLDYEAYPAMAVQVMDTIARRIEDEVDGARVVIHHRVGRLVVGEPAVVIAASAPHRAEAFDACRRAIEALKQDVPIWKKEFDADGGTWIGQGP